MRLLMAHQAVKKSVSTMCDVWVKVASFIFLADFVILDCEMDFNVPINLEKPFLATGWALVDMDIGNIKFKLNNE